VVAPNIKADGREKGEGMPVSSRKDVGKGKGKCFIKNAPFRQREPTGGTL